MTTHNNVKDPDLELDFHDIATSVARQSSLYDYYSERAIDARAERDTAVNALEKRTAEKELEIRKNASDRGEKMTESKVSALVDADVELAELKAVVVEKNKDMQKLESKCRAFDHKKTMIECSVRMIVSKSMGLSQDGVTTEYADEDVSRRIRAGLNR